MELPPVLSTHDPGQVHSIFQAIEASTQSPLDEVRKPAEQLLKACEELPGYTSVLAAIATTHAAPRDARATAVILLKNMVRVRWKSRGGRGVVVGDAEKAALRVLLSAGVAMEEPEAMVASQLAVLVGKVARVDWPREWPQLFPNLVASLVSASLARRRMALCSTNEVLRELSTKRIGFDRASFVKTAAGLLSVLCQAWDAQWALVDSLLPSIASGNVPSKDSEAGTNAAEAISLGTVCVKIIRRLLQFGIPGLEHPSVEPLFAGLLQRMQEVVMALSQHQAVAVAKARATMRAAQQGQHGEGGATSESAQEGGVGGVLCELQELAERMACTAVDAQKDHPIGFRRYLSAYLSFFCEQLSALARDRSPTPASSTAEGAGLGAWAGGRQEGGGGLWRDTSDTFGGVVDTQSIGPFCIQCMAFVGNVVGCSSYRDDVLQKAIATATIPTTSTVSTAAGGATAAAGGTGRPAPVGRIITGRGDAVITPDVAREISSTLAGFFTKDRVISFFGILLEGYLTLTYGELKDWKDQPEEYHLLQDSIEARESVRVSAQQVYLAFLEATGGGLEGILAEAVAQMLSQGVQDQIETCRQTSISPQVLTSDALYLCAGLGAYSVKKHFDFSAWFEAFLAPALEALVSSMQATARHMPVSDSLPPLILLRRLVWLLGCWAEQVPASLRPALVQATANVMKAAEADLVIRLSALSALQSLLSLWDLDPEQCLAPALPWLVPALYGMFEDVEEMENRQEVLTVLSELLSRSGRLLVPHCQTAVAGLPNVWNATSSQTPLRCGCLQVMTHVVDALGSDRGPDLDRIALAMLDVSTKVGSDEAVYLMEAGLSLWLAMLRHSTGYLGGLHNLFPRIPEMLQTDLDNLKLAMLILEAHVVIGGTVFLQAHGPLVCTCFCRVVGQVKPQGAAFVSRSLETVLRQFPADGSKMLHDGGVVRQVAEACFVGIVDSESCSSREPDLVIVQHLTVLCRVLLGAPDAFRGVLHNLAESLAAISSTDNQKNSSSCINGNGSGGSAAANPEWVLAELVGQMTTLFDSAGYSVAGVWRRRIWAMSLLKLLPSANSGIIKNLDQIVNICVDVLTEESEDGGKRLTEGLTQMSSEEPGTTSSAQPNALQSRMEEALRGDVAVTTDLRLLIRESMGALRATLGNEGWQAAVETVEPVVLNELQRMVA